MDENETIVNKLNAFSIRKSLLCIASIDLILNFLNLLSSRNIESGTDKNIVMYTSLGLCFMILLGIIGINRYKINFVYCYFIYSLIQLIKYILIIFLLDNSDFIILSMLSLLVSCLILRLTSKFIKNLKSLDHIDIESLQNGWQPSQYRIVLY